MVTIASCVPRQEVTIEAKLQWLREALDKTPCDLFLLPQEYIGGHYVHHNLSGAQMPLHVPRSRVVEMFGAIAGNEG
jgi:hypothetical protein